MELRSLLLYSARVRGEGFPLSRLHTKGNDSLDNFLYIGTEDEARKYSAKITVYSDKEQAARLQWKVPVEPIHKCGELKRGNEITGVIIPS